MFFLFCFVLQDMTYFNSNAILAKKNLMFLVFRVYAVDALYAIIHIAWYLKGE